MGKVRVAMGILVGALLATAYLAQPPDDPSGDTASPDQRRPLPDPTIAQSPAAAASDQAGSADAGGSHGRSVRRPLPAPAPTDPVVTVQTAAIPTGHIAVGTSFPVGQGLWLTARHVANSDCDHIVLQLGKTTVPATIKALHDQADMTLLQTTQTAPALEISTAPLQEDEVGRSFGFPTAELGAAQESLLGRARMQLGGRLQGTAPIVEWAEEARFPASLDTLQGMSGGPVLDSSGRIVGIMVAATARRGRIDAVAPEVIRDWLPQFRPTLDAPPVAEVTGTHVSLGDAAKAIAANSRIAETYCLPQE